MKTRKKALNYFFLNINDEVLESGMEESFKNITCLGKHEINREDVLMIKIQISNYSISNFQKCMQILRSLTSLKKSELRIVIEWNVNKSDANVEYFIYEISARHQFPIRVRFTGSTNVA